MDYDSYNAATEGNIEFFKNHQSNLDCLLTPNENTVLHIYITALISNCQSTTPIVGSESTTLNVGSKSPTNFGRKILQMCHLLLQHVCIKSLNFGSKATPGVEFELTTPNAGSESRTKFVDEILVMCPNLLNKANTDGETPLHIAARYGHDDIVDVLIKYCARTLDQDPEGGIGPVVEEMLRKVNKKNDTALHEAVRYNHLNVVQLLIESNPNFLYSANDAGETPLYIAAERGFDDVVIEILDNCKSPAHRGPLGRTALHAAVLGKRGITRRILDKIEGISRIVDNDGWTPLHFAAYDYSSSLAEKLLDKDRDLAYMKDKEGRTALHIAAHKGNVLIVSLIVSRCPDCCELVDNRGWNLLHFAFKNPRLSSWFVIDAILKNSSLKYLLNKENADGDTPLHYSFSTALLARNFIGDPRVDKMAFNKKNLCPWDIFQANIELYREEEIGRRKKKRRTKRGYQCCRKHLKPIW